MLLFATIFIVSVNLKLSYLLTISECEFNSSCSLQWKRYERKQKHTGTSVGSNTLCGCALKCVQSATCNAIDRDSNDLCWLHHNNAPNVDDLKDNSYVNHYVLERNCTVPTTETSSFNDKNLKFLESETFSGNLTALLKESNDSAANIINVLSSIDEITETLETLLDASTKEIIADKITMLVQSCSQILDRNATWNQLSRDEKSQITGKLFLSIEKCAVLFSKCSPDSKDDFLLNSTNILIKIISSVSKDEVYQATQKSKQNFRISNKNLNGNSSKIIIVSYINISEIFSTHTGDVIPQIEDAATDRCDAVRGSNPKRDLNSNVMSATIINKESKPVTKLVDPINITFQHIKTNNGMTPICVFWNFSSENGEGGWSSVGCRVTSSSAGETICTCDHLTNFAILMSFTDHVLSKEAEYRLSLITYIGCAISLLCLLLAFVTFSVFRSLQCDRNSIHKNLVACLFVAELIFFLGVDRICNPILCTIVAICLHYFFLSSFMWMCMEGFQLYVLLVHVFNAEKRRIRIYYPVAYGIPAVVLIICISIGLEGYGTNQHCWLSRENGFIWAFIGPVIVILVINLHMLIITMVTMCRLANNAPIQHKESEKKIKKILLWIKSAFVLMVLLGSTWLIGLFYVDQTTVIMAYIFTFLNSLQGCFIFVCHCLLNKKVCKEYYKCWQRLPFNRSADFSKSSKSEAKEKRRRGTDTTSDTNRRATEAVLILSAGSSGETRVR